MAQSTIQPNFRNVQATQVQQPQVATRTQMPEMTRQAFESSSVLSMQEPSPQPESKGFFRTVLDVMTYIPRKIWEFVSNCCCSSPAAEVDTVDHQDVLEQEPTKVRAPLDQFIASLSSSDRPCGSAEEMQKCAQAALAGWKNLAKEDRVAFVNFYNYLTTKYVGPFLNTRVVETEAFWVSNPIVAQMIGVLQSKEGLENLVGDIASKKISNEGLIDVFLSSSSPLNKIHPLVAQTFHGLTTTVLNSGEDITTYLRSVNMQAPGKSLDKFREACLSAGSIMLEKSKTLGLGDYVSDGKDFIKLTDKILTTPITDVIRNPDLLGRVPTNLPLVLDVLTGLPMNSDLIAITAWIKQVVDERNQDLLVLEQSKGKPYPEQMMRQKLAATEGLFEYAMALNDEIMASPLVEEIKKIVKDSRSAKAVQDLMVAIDGGSLAAAPGGLLASISSSLLFGKRNDEVTDHNGNVVPVSAHALISAVLSMQSRNA